MIKLPPSELARVLQLRGWCGSEIALDYILSLLYKFRVNSLKFTPRVGAVELWNLGSLDDDEVGDICAVCTRGAQ